MLLLSIEEGWPMRIVSGEYKSRKLKTLVGDSTRPTSDKIRGAIFDSIAFEANMDSMLDVFSGSGAMAIEAISRGFKLAYANDNNRAAIKIIKENINALKLNQEISVFNLDYKRFLKAMADKQVDLIFIDPPYDKFDLSEIMDMINEYNILRDQGLVIIEGSKALILDENIGHLSLFKEKAYKATVIKYYRKDD